MARIEGADISIEDFLEESQGLSQSNLQKSFEKTSVLLTGVTSFIGSVVLEKLLRSCPGIECIYVLIRSKNGKEPVERMKELFRSLLFDRLKMEYPETMNKVHVIPCDFIENDLGISNDDYLMITTKVSAIIHTARLIGSSIKLKESVLINVRALYSLLKLCQDIKILDGFAYVSSIYAHFNETLIEEKLYPCSLTGDGLINMVENLSEETLENITAGITGKHPNISTLTIAVAERILHEKGEGLPICIIRPSFVLPSCNEPIAGWIQQQRIESPTDILLNVFLGKIVSINCDGRKPAEAVPVDKVANLIIAAIGSLQLKRKEWINQAVIISNSLKKTIPTVSDFRDIQIYNMVLSNKQKLTWSEFFDKSIEHVEEVPFLDAVWNSSLQMNKYWLIHWLITWFQLGKIILLDQIKGNLGMNYELVKTVKTDQILTEKILNFMKKHWHLKDDNVTKLWDAISDSDRSHFDFNLRNLDWNHFFDTQCRGLRVYLLKDPLSTVHEARNNQKWMKKAYNLSAFLIISCIIIIIYKCWL